MHGSAPKHTMQDISVLHVEYDLIRHPRNYSFSCAAQNGMNASLCPCYIATGRCHCDNRWRD